MTTTEPIRKRKRAAISCTLCRKRKIRCNRETPCSNCVRSRNATCIYEIEHPKAALGQASLHSGPIAPRPSEVTQAGGILSPQQIPYQRSDTRRPPGLPHPHARYTESGPKWAISVPMTPESNTSIELESMRSRLAELQDQLSRTTGSRQSTVSAPASSIAAPSPAPISSVHVTSGLAGPIDVLQDNRIRDYPIARGIAHKNRVFGQSHWMNGFVVFRDIVELLEPQMRNSSSLLPNMHRAKVLARIIKMSRSPAWPTLPTRELPPRDICDALVGYYLRTIETLYRVLHVPTFQKDYESLWTEGSEPKIAFIMQVKLVLAIGAIFHDENCSLRPDATRWIYEAQTWMSSPNAKSKLGLQSLQTSILLLLAREFADVGSELVWISAGALLREAVYIGLHKDPGQLPRMNLLESEMRRRVWNTLLELNLQFSLISGGPCLISMEDFNTEMPGNYNDDQLNQPDTRSHPEHVFTQTSCAIALRKTFRMRLAAVKFLNDVGTSGTYEETLRIDTALRASCKALRRSIQAYTTSAAELSFAADAIEFIMQRYVSSLHIPYFNPALHEAAYAFSRKAVLDTSLKIWNLGFSRIASSETDIARLCRCGAGFFRGFTFHASSFLTVELRAQMQEEDSVPRPDLLSIPEDAANLVLRCIEAGETGIKGYLLLRILIAQIDAIKRHVRPGEMQVLLGQAAEQAVEQCVPMLERMANQSREDTTTTGVETVGDFDFQISPDMMGDWDLAMADVFDFDSGGSFADGHSLDAFLT